jgi:hypothetical protein
MAQDQAPSPRNATPEPDRGQDQNQPIQEGGCDARKTVFSSWHGVKIDKTPELSQRFPLMVTVFHLRPYLIALGALLLAAVLYPGSRKYRKQVEDFLERHYCVTLSCLSISFFLAAYAGKLSQLRTLSLNSEDFWLFEDMLRFMKSGEFFLTRFGPQAIGFIQHGAVHPFFTWILTVPLAWLFGPTQACLIFEPLVFALTGVTLAALIRPRGRAFKALFFTLGFYCFNQVARILNYDVHPEAAYPFFTLLWAWAAGLGDSRTRPLPLLFFTLALVGIKEDSFLIFYPLLAATMIASRRNLRALAWLGASGLVGLAVTGFQFHAVHQWVAGQWGPHTLDGFPVSIPQGAEVIRNRHWEGPASALQLARDIVAQKGGIFGTLTQVVKFLFSRPFLSILIIAPWVAAQPLFWLASLPLLSVNSLLDAPSKFINYYSAPFLGIFWLAAAGLLRGYHPKKHHTASLWVLISCLLLGGQGLNYYRSTPDLLSVKKSAENLTHCLPSGARGVVTGPFLGIVPRNQVMTDRDPAASGLQSDFFLFSTLLPSFELPPDSTKNLLHRLQNDPHWVILNESCQPQLPGESPLVYLFVKK